MGHVDALSRCFETTRANELDVIVDNPALLGIKCADADTTIDRADLTKKSLRLLNRIKLPNVFLTNQDVLPHG